MPYRILLLLFMVVAATLAACGSDSETVATTEPDHDTASTSPDQLDAATPTPAPEPTPVVPSSNRLPVVVDDVEFIIRESYPMTVAAEISGSLPTPCHELRWTLEAGETTTEDDWSVAADGSVHTITVWTTDLPPDTTCAAVIEPFTQTVELGRFIGGDYTIVVNGERFPLSL